ncbi:MAG: formylmethanofuran dehydrogenase [Methanotrichaceae archaeon]|nr:formylmethanofuran dehydrogenase [Methanotrichaceae archaeon]
MSLELSIVTVRDIFQSEVQEVGRFSSEYQKMSAIIILDKGDTKTLGVADGGRLLVESSSGSVVVGAKVDDQPHKGLAFMPNSPWSNQLVSEETGESRIPEYKSIQAEVSTTDDSITDLSEILARMRE